MDLSVIKPEQCVMFLRVGYQHWLFYQKEQDTNLAWLWGCVDLSFCKRAFPLDKRYQQNPVPGEWKLCVIPSVIKARWCDCLTKSG